MNDENLSQNKKRLYRRKAQAIPKINQNMALSNILGLPDSVVSVIKILIISHAPRL